MEADSLEQTKSLHDNHDCHSPSLDHNENPRPPTVSICFKPKVNISDEDMLVSCKRHGSPYMQIVHGKVVIPHIYLDYQNGPNLAKASSSLGSISLPPIPYSLSHCHQDLVWCGSSLGTVHKVPFQEKKKAYTQNLISKYPSSPKMVSKKMSCGQFSLLTASECSSDMYYVCRICQMVGDEKDPLISPCRCSGTLRYVHISCLKKWVRISQRRSKQRTPQCEICYFQFLRHKQFKFNQWRWPSVCLRDKCLHIIFLLNVLIMVACAVATIICFLSDKDSVVKFPKNKISLTFEEVVTLTCGIMFFVSFFVAMTVEIKARHTLYKLFLIFMMHNTEWTIRQYDPRKDTLLKNSCKASVV